MEKVESFCSEVGFEFVDADAEDETDGMSNYFLVKMAMRTLSIFISDSLFRRWCSTC